jgi:hypothetical protein
VRDNIKIPPYDLCSLFQSCCARARTSAFTNVPEGTGICAAGMRVCAKRTVVCVIVSRHWGGFDVEELHVIV